MRDNIIFQNSEIASDRLFADVIIGNLLSRRNFADISRISKQCNVTERRIYQAIERLIEQDRLVRIFNYIIPEVNIHGNLKEIKQFRSNLLKYHGIVTPKPIFYKGTKYTVLFWSSSYFGINAGGQKASSYLPPKVRKNYPLILLFSSPAKYCLWEFNKTVYNFQDYLNNFGFKHLC